MIGAAIGITIRNMMRMSLAPSIRADSSRDSGMVRK